MQIEKFGPSSTPTVQVGILIPYELISMDGTFKQISKVTAHNDTSLDSVVVKCAENMQIIAGRYNIFKRKFLIKS